MERGRCIELKLMEFEEDDNHEDGDGAYGDSLTQANLPPHNGDDVSLTQCAVMEPMEAMKMQYEEQGPKSVDCVGIIIEDDHNRKEPAYSFFLADGIAKLGSTTGTLLEFAISSWMVWKPKGFPILH